MHIWGDGGRRRRLGFGFRKERPRQTGTAYLALTMTSGRDSSSSKRGKCPLLLELASGMQGHATNYKSCSRFSGVCRIDRLTC